MASSTFSKIIKSLWVLIAFIPFINGLGFAYIGAKEFKREWIIEGLIYEIPWFFGFIFINYDGIADVFIGLGLLLMLVGIIRSFIIYYKYKDILIDDDPESQIDIDKSSSSFWVIFSVIIFLNGVGLIIVGQKRNVKRWIIEGIVFEFLWVLSFITSNSSDVIFNFFLALALAGLILSIVRTFMIYFEEEKMDMDNYPSKPIADAPVEAEPKTVNNVDNISSSEIIPQFRAYNTQINELRDEFNHKEENITNLINNRFNKEELSYDRFTSVIDNCHKIFNHQADAATSIIQLAPEFSERLDESVKGKISILESINDEMNNLLEELILHDGDEKQSDEDLKELFSNMDNLINSVKDYR